MRVLISTTSMRRIVRQRDRASCERSITSTQVNEYEFGNRKSIAELWPVDSKK